MEVEGIKNLYSQLTACRQEQNTIENTLYKGISEWITDNSPKGKCYCYNKDGTLAYFKVIDIQYEGRYNRPRVILKGIRYYSNEGFAEAINIDAPLEVVPRAEVDVLNEEGVNDMKNWEYFSDRWGDNSKMVIFGTEIDEMEFIGKMSQWYNYIISC